MICGHLPERLGELADGIIAEAAAPRRPPSRPPAAAPARASCSAAAAPAAGEPDGDGRPRGAEQPEGCAPLSLEEIFSNAAQSEEILDVFI